MCGLVGIATAKPEPGFMRSYMQTGLYVDTLRGIDSTGVALMPRAVNSPSTLLKSTVPGPEFLQLKKTNKLFDNLGQYQAIIGHNRAGTRGGYGYSDAHPFHSGNVMLAHNGSLTWTSNLEDHPDTSVDSAKICASMAKAQKDGTNPTDILKTLQGAYALSWFDLEDRTLNFARNGERDLYFVEPLEGKCNFIAWASEPWMIEAGMSRTNWVRDNRPKTKLFYFEEHALYSFKIESDELKFEKTNYKPETRTFSYQGSYSNYKGGTDSYQGNLGKNTRGTGKTSHGGSKVSKPHLVVSNKTGTEKINEMLGKFFRKINHTPLVVGDWVEFHVTEAHILEDKKKDNCTVMGECKDWPALKTIAVDVSYDEANSPENITFKGKVCQAIEKRQSKHHEKSLFLMLEEVKPCLVVETDANGAETLKREGEEPIFFGPNGTKLTFTELEEMLDSKCYVCNGKIYALEHEEIHWADDSSPVCPSCVKKLGLNEPHAGSIMEIMTS